MAIVDFALNNSTVTTSGSYIHEAGTSKESILFWNIRGAITGTSPTIQFTLQELDPYDRSSTIGQTVNSSVITTTGTGQITLSLGISTIILVKWTVTGTTPSFGGVSAGIVSRDNAGVVTNNQGNAGSSAQSWYMQGASSSGSPVSGNPVYIGGKDPSGNAQPISLTTEQSQYIAAAPNKQTVQSNTTLTASGSTIFSTYGSKEIDLFINIKNAPTGTSPTLTYTLQEIDPGDNTTSLGASVSSTSITVASTQVISLPVTKSPVIKVSWTVTGTTPSFTGVYATLVTKIAGNAQLYDGNGNAIGASNPLTIQFGNPTGANIAFGDVALASITTAAVERTTYTEQTTNFTGSIVSSNVNDTAAGTGARTITITYIDQTGATLTTSTYTLNGTTAVNLSATGMCFIESIIVDTVGTGGVNAGTISLFTGAGGTGTLVATVAVGDNRTFWAHHYVVTGKTCKIQGTVLGSTSTTVGAGNIGFIKAKSLTNSSKPEEQVTDILTLYGQSSMAARVYTTAIPIAAGPARVRAYVTTQSSTSQTYRFSFDYIDQ